MIDRHDTPKTLKKAFASVAISEESFRAADQFLAKLPLEVRIHVLEKAMRAATAPVVQRAKQLAPDSEKSGSRKKWSKKTRAKRVGTKPHKQTIGASSVRTYRGGLLAIYVGPIHPAGNLINVIGHQHKQVLWGKHTGKVLPGTEYLKQAAEQTLAQQQSAFVDKVKSETEKLLAKP